MRLLDGDIDANIPSIVSPDACIYSINKVLACWSSPRSLKLTAMNTGPFSDARNGTYIGVDNGNMRFLKLFSG
jgi:hypothetical protein